MATRDDRYSSYRYNLLVWNYSASPTLVEIALAGLAGDLTAKPVVLDAVAVSDDEIARLRPERPFQIKADQPTFRASLDPYGVRFWALEERR